MLKRKLSGFTLVELLVAMAIISVLIGLAVGAISLANRSSRDSQRRAAVFEVSAAINEYYGRTSAYPTTITVQGNTIQVGNNTVNLSGPALPAAATTANGTAYCYSRTAGGYVLGAGLEGDLDGQGGQSTWFTDQSLDQTLDSGQRDTTCSTNLLQ